MSSPYYSSKYLLALLVLPAFVYLLQQNTPVLPPDQFANISAIFAEKKLTVTPEPSQAPLDLLDADSHVIIAQEYASIPQYVCEPERAAYWQLETPLNVVWSGKVLDLMQSGMYYRLLKFPPDETYPYFGLSFSDGAAHDLSGEVEVSGILRGIECGSYASVFGWQARPEVEALSVVQR